MKREVYEPVNPHAIGEPHLLAGYTGYVPGFGAKRQFQMGESYGRMTRRLMTNHPIAGNRLAPILDDSKARALERQEQYLMNKHERETKIVKYRDPMVTGYSGYIPRKYCVIGKCYPSECKTAVSEFQQVLDVHRQGQADPELKIGGFRGSKQKQPEDVKTHSTETLPLNKSVAHPKTVYHISNTMMGPNKLNRTYDPSGGSRNWDQMVSAADRQRTLGNRFTVDVMFRHRMNESAKEVPWSKYGNHREQDVPFRMPEPWYKKKDLHPDHALVEVCAHTFGPGYLRDVDKNFYNGLRRGKDEDKSCLLFTK